MAAPLPGNVLSWREDRAIVRQAFFHGALVDDATGRAWPGEAAGACNDPLLTVIARNGRYALAGDPDVALRDLAAAQDRTLTLSPEGARASATVLTAPAGAIFPLAMPEIRLRRLPVALRGRISDFGTGAGVGGAALELLQPAGLPAGQAAILLAVPLSRDLPAGAAVTARATAPAGGPANRRAIAEAWPGATEITLSSTANLAAGRVLRLGPTHRVQHVAVDAVLAGGVVRLVEPLQRAVRRDDPALALTLGGPIGAQAGLVGPGFRGEAVLILDDAPAAGFIEITDGVGPTLLRGVGATADPAGAVAIAGLARIAEPAFRITAAGYAPLQQGGPLDWSLPVNIREWALRP